MSTRQGFIPSAGRGLALTAIAVLLLVAGSGSPSVAAPATAPQHASAAAASHEVTDFSAARRRHYRRGPSAAGLAFMGMATGLIAGAIAEQQRRDYYESHYYYGPRPYYGPGYGYYGPQPYYGPRYYYRPY